jgi:DNA-binding GntR family transcriptional regulator
MIEAASSDQISVFMRLDRECDEILASAARNPYATRAASTLHAHCRRFWYLYKNNGDLRESVDRHAALMHAVADGDVELAEQASDLLLDYLVSFARLPFEQY